MPASRILRITSVLINRAIAFFVYTKVYKLGSNAKSVKSVKSIKSIKSVKSIKS